MAKPEWSSGPDTMKTKPMIAFWRHKTRSGTLTPSHPSGCFTWLCSAQTADVAACLGGVADDRFKSGDTSPKPHDLTLRKVAGKTRLAPLYADTIRVSEMAAKYKKIKTRLGSCKRIAPNRTWQAKPPAICDSFTASGGACTAIPA